jgi:protein involved in ribonucleotide reduction
MPTVVYFSSASENTKRFMEKVGLPSTAVALRGTQPEMAEQYVLVTPSYGGGELPKQVERFLDTGANASLIRGVIGAGNTNFGEDYCKAAKSISMRYGVPLLYKFELMGTPEDVANVRQGLARFLASIGLDEGA